MADPPPQAQNLRRMVFGVVGGCLDGCHVGGYPWKRGTSPSFSRSFLAPPLKKYLPARLGPGSRDVAPQMASSCLLDRSLEATTISRWLDMLPRWCWELFTGRLDRNLISSWAPLGMLWGPTMQYKLTLKRKTYTCMYSTY